MKQAAEYNNNWKNLKPGDMVTHRDFQNDSGDLIPFFFRPLESEHPPIVFIDGHYLRMEGCFPFVQQQDANNLITAVEWLTATLEAVLRSKPVRDMDHVTEFARLTVKSARGL